ncbi:MAG: DUF1178 family protein [Pseudomonadota bacterium]
MIRYALKCDQDHGFESWFSSADDFDKLHAAGMVTCPACGSEKVSKSLMAPRVPAKSNRGGDKEVPMSAGPDPKIAAAIKELKDHVEKNSDYVGTKFADEARAMHLGDKPERSIYGEVKPEEAKRLRKDGVPALPLPFTPKRKTN